MLSKKAINIANECDALLEVHLESLPDIVLAELIVLYDTCSGRITKRRDLSDEQKKEQISRMYKTHCLVLAEERRRKEKNKDEESLC